MKKLLKIALAVVVPVVMAIPGTALAHSVPPDTAVVSVFTGTAIVNPGLCLPADVSPACTGPTAATYELAVPGASAPLPAVCFAAGVFEGAPVAPGVGDILTDGNCGLVAHGDVTGSLDSPPLDLTPPLPALKPSCGLSHGASNDAVGPNNVTLNGSTRNVNDGWITSAGGTIPVTGEVDDADADTSANGDHLLVALVQARPVGPTGTIACVTAPASSFIIAGVAAVV